MEWEGSELLMLSWLSLFGLGFILTSYWPLSYYITGREVRQVLSYGRFDPD